MSYELDDTNGSEERAHQVRNIALQQNVGGRGQLLT